MAARTGRAKLAGVIGYPVGHSLSPALHEYWLRDHGIDGAYIPLEVPQGNFEETLRTLHLLGFRGANVTLPYKEEAFAAVTMMDETARLSGAVNTLVRAEEGFTGKNTDVEGFMENLRTHNVTPQDLRRAVILGAGGAARAIVAALYYCGCRNVAIVNRTQERAEKLIDEIEKTGIEGCFEAPAWKERQEILAECDILVNTTQLGMTGQPPLELDLSALPTAAVVSDIVYNPLVTPLLAQAKARGNNAVGGLGMLLHQAVPGFEAWFGVRPEVTPELYEYVASLVGA